jgi:hypothetical protein
MFSVALAATLLHFFTDFLEQLKEHEIPLLIISLLRYVEISMFICDILVFSLYIIVKTIIEVCEILLLINIDVYSFARWAFRIKS